MSAPGGVPGLGGGCLLLEGVPGPGGVGVYLVLGGVPGPRGMCLVPGGVPGLGGCTWSGGCNWSQGVYLVPGGVCYFGGVYLVRYSPPDRHTPVNILPCPKLRLRAVTTVTEIKCKRILEKSV